MGGDIGETMLELRSKRLRGELGREGEEGLACAEKACPPRAACGLWGGARSVELEPEVKGELAGKRARDRDRDRGG